MTHMSEKKFVTPPQILISSQVLLLESIRGLSEKVGWSIGKYLHAVDDLGVKLMYEPVRSTLSLASAELRSDPKVGAGISMLAEPARSEVNLKDYLTPRIPYQILFAFIQQHRFTDETLVFLKKLQRSISTPDHPVPVRVYAARPGFHSVILDDGLEHKIYAQNHGGVLAGALGHMQGMNENDSVERLVQEILRDVEQYPVSGIELNILGLLVALQRHPNLIFDVINALLERSTSNTQGNALVQSVAVQPNRKDLLDNVEMREMEQILKIIAECGFAGSIVYAPGGGSDIREEINQLKVLFRFA